MAPTNLHAGPKPRFNETAVAIGVSMVIAIVLATLMTGSPFRALQLAYLDYTATPAGGAPAASDTQAPANNAAPAATGANNTAPATNATGTPPPK